MLRLFVVLALVAVGFYVAALFHVETDMGEVLSDVGNAILLLTITGLLLRRERRDARGDAA